MMQMLQAGAAIRVSINGSVTAFATGLTWSRSLNTKVIYELDSPFAKEIMPTTYAVQGTLAGFRIRGSGGLDGYQIMNSSTAAAFFNQKYCLIEIVDILSGVTMYTFQKAVFDTDSWNLQNKQLLTFSASFKAVFIQNEQSDKS
jgi:hypothetical protein